MMGCKLELVVERRDRKCTVIANIFLDCWKTCPCTVRSITSLTHESLAGASNITCLFREGVSQFGHHKSKPHAPRPTAWVNAAIFLQSLRAMSERFDSTGNIAMPQNTQSPAAANASRANLTSPIHRLPNELIADIFVMGCPAPNHKLAGIDTEPFRHQMLVGSICRLWRETAH